jgi:hypothetical protein
VLPRSASRRRPVGVVKDLDGWRRVHFGVRGRRIGSARLLSGEWQGGGGAAEKLPAGEHYALIVADGMMRPASAGRESRRHR